MQRWMVSLTAAALLSGCVSRTVVRRITTPSASADPDKYVLAKGSQSSMEKGGVYYALPRTRVLVDVTVERMDFNPGRLAQLAASCPAAGNVGVEKKTVVTLRTGSISTQNEADPGHVFLMDVTGRYFENKRMDAKFSSHGTLSSALLESDDQSVEVALKALAAAASLAQSLQVHGSPQSTETTNEEELKKRKSEAEELCSQYKQVLANRSTFLRTLQGGMAKETLQAVMNEFELAAQQLLQPFRGTTQKVAATRRFQVLPTANQSATSYELLIFDPGVGICSTNTALLVGEGFPADFQTSACSDKKQPLLLQHKTSSGGMHSVLATASQQESGERGIPYRIPAEVPFALVWGDTHFANETLEIAQFGPVVSLPASTGGRKTTYTADFTPAGALKNFQVNSTALLDKGLVDALKNTADSALDAYNKSNDPVSPLKKKKELLDAQKAVLDAQKALEKAQAEAGAAKQD